MEKIKHEEEFKKALEAIGVRGELPEDTSFEKMGINSIEKNCNNKYIEQERNTIYG